MEGCLMTHRDLQQNSGRGADTPDRSTTEENPPMAQATVQDERPRICDRCEDPLPPFRWANVDQPAYGKQCECESPHNPLPVKAEYVDLFRRDLPELTPVADLPNLSAVKRMRMEIGASPLEFAAEHLEDARPELMQALKFLDCTEHRDVYERLQKVVLEVDDLRSVLAERWTR